MFGSCRVKNSVPPSHAPSNACDSAIARRAPLAGSTANSCPAGNPEPRRDVNSTSPFGVQPMTKSRRPSHVSRRGLPPSSGMTYTSVGPSYVAENATVWPSGESAARVSSPKCDVSRCASPPASGTRHRSPSAVNTTVPFRSVGNR